MTTAVRFQQVSRRFGDVDALNGVDLAIREGSFFAMLGPSGSGKTTCLRLISGFDRPTSGHVEIFGVRSETIPPNQRPVNTVFQDYALFPHLNVIDNVAFGLRVRGMSRVHRHREAESMLELVKLAGFGARMPSQLSGGQRQRVALARALVNQPRVLLLDEPLGALDLKLREQMQEELKTLQTTLGITFIFVTHDQGEALSMSDSIAVINAGQIEQVGSPEEIYLRPRSRFVADFVGASNILSPELSSMSGGEHRWSSLRPESVSLVPPGDGVLDGTLESIRYLGATKRVLVSVQGDTIAVQMPASTELPASGESVSLAWPASALHAMDAE